MNDSLAFIKLKPLLVNFLRNCTFENVMEIEDVIKELDPDSIDKLQEFILFPFIAHLSTELNEKIVIKCLNFLTYLFNKVQLRVWKVFVDIFNVLISKLGNAEDMYKASRASEELKMAVCECFSNLICCSNEEVLNEMYSFTFRPYLAHAFFILIPILNEERSKLLLKFVLQTMGALTYNDTYLKKKYEMTRLIASEALASCLPGLSVTLLKVITKDDKQAHSVISMALDILGKLIILTIGDESFERDIANDTSSEIHYIAYKSGKLSEKRASSIVNSIPLVLKNKAWFESVAQNIEFLVKNLIVLSSHNHWKVRHAFFEFSNSLLCNCSRTLKNCIPVLLPVMFGFSVDSNEIVSSSAKNALASLSKKFQNMDNYSLNETVEDNIEKLVAQLIKCKLSANDSKKLTILKSFLGYLEISNLTLNKLMFSAVFFQRIILTLLTLLEFDISELNLIEELPTFEVLDIDISHNLWPKKRFKFFENEEILTVISKICYSLGKIGNARVLIEYLLEKLSLNDLHTLQCIFVIGSVFKGFSNESDDSEKYLNLINETLEVFLSPSLFEVPLSNDNLDTYEQVSSESNLTHNILNKNKFQVCLILEAIASCSECLKTNFKIHLKSVLCPVMEKAGNSNYIISHCGRLCLQYIAKFCNYPSVQDLFKNNADYITNLIMINFHGYLYKPEIAHVLRVAMEHNDAEAIVLFRDLIFQILDFLDYNQEKAYPLLQVLLSVAVCIKKWFPCKKNSLNGDSSKNSEMQKNLREAIEDYIKLKKASELENCTIDDATETAANFEHENLTKEISQNNDDIDCSIDENKPEIPLHINIICEIFKRCVHMQSSGNRFARMLTLEIVEVCILALGDYENQLHPLVHEFWKPFLKRFTEDTFVPKAFNLLLTIANECGDFVRSRISKEVMPKIMLFLKQECSKSLLKSFRQYQYTSNHSLQVLLLSEIGNLCTKFDIDDDEFNAVTTTCLSYIKKEQPRILQEAAVKSLKTLSTIDSDAIWFYWNVAFSTDKVLYPPNENLHPVSFPCSNNSLTSLNFNFF